MAFALLTSIPHAVQYRVSACLLRVGYATLLTAAGSISFRPVQKEYHPVPKVVGCYSSTLFFSSLTVESCAVKEETAPEAVSVGMDVCRWSFADRGSSFL